MYGDCAASQAVNNAIREHTVRSVLTLAKHYGFDANEALAVVGLPREARHPRPVNVPADGDPVPVIGTSSDDEAFAPRRCPKPRLTTSKNKKTNRRATRKKRASKTN